MRTYIIPLCVLILIAAGCRAKEEKPITKHEVIELVTLFQKHAGADKSAEKQLKAGGEKTKAILLQLLDDPNTPESFAGNAGAILHLYFPCDETYDALDRFAGRIPDPEERERQQQIMKAMRAMPWKR